MLFVMDYLAWLVIGVALGAVAAWLVARTVRKTQAAAQATEVERLKTETAQAQAAAAAATVAAAEMKAELAGAVAQRDAAVAQAAEITRDREQLVNQFKALSAEAIEAQERKLDASAALRHEKTEQLLTPVKESLEKFNSRITEVEKERTAMSVQLQTQVREVRNTGDELRKETAALVTALRKPHVRGAWGELQLTRVVELAGMVEHCDFESQETAQTTSGSTIRPDLKVLLSEDRYLYVDSKVPLSAFLEAHETEDPAERSRLLTNFARNVTTHIDQLGRKDYFKAGGSTPEYVVLFLPSEALAAEAFQQLPTLHEYANDRGVVIATPSTLIGLLKAAAYTWRQAALADSAREVFELGRELYDRLSKLGSNFDKVGRMLNGTVKAYNESVGSIEGRVFPTARKLRDLKVVDKQLDPVNSLDTSARPLTAPELVEDAAAVTPIIGRSRAEAIGADDSDGSEEPPALDQSISG